MATFHIGHQHGQIQNAGTIYNGSVTHDLAQVAEILPRLLADLRRQAARGDIDLLPAERAMAEIETAADEAARPNAPCAPVRSALLRAAGVLSDVAAAATIVTALQAAAASLPIG